MGEADVFWSGILRWYSRYGRDYPWRRTSYPFHILCAEFLLQQTHVRKVQKVYDELIKAYPSPRQLAEADLCDVERIIQPIGLRYRAKRLKRCSEIICSEFSGKVPDSSDQLQKLPGVGSYICDAVLCYGFGQNTIPVDTNVIRVFCRYLGFKSDKPRPRTDKILAEKIRKMYKGLDSTRNANLAVLDFAGLVCTANRPKCEECPVAAGCSAEL